MITNSPTCSHCGYEFDDEETWHGGNNVGKVHTGDGDLSKLTCPNDDCQKIFHVNCFHLVKFEQVDEHGDTLG